ncbi:alpha/beta fold hydrolase [Psychrobacter sp.]|uniref:lipase family alpha/beta hydrolase n=1 Tax=Psychrobacter sp. TaxID=56811 RepID=UPI0025E55729|nr:alpha/beta fold hydrolase [Psychrobacter sp.]
MKHKLKLNPKACSVKQDKPLVILIHGLHQRAWIMWPLAKYLQKQGFSTYLHDYYSLRDNIDKHSNRLNEWLTANHDPSTAINLVGHSLGGLIIRDFISRYPQWKIARCVTLGTPHNGSTTATYLKKLISPLVGNSFEKALDGQNATLTKGISLGVIAGNSPKGLGQIILNYHIRQAKLIPPYNEHDGTVFVFETKLPQAADHITLPVSHTGMLFDRKVAQQTAYFLDHGMFKSIDSHN